MSDKYRVVIVPTEMVELIWDKTIPHMQRAVDKSHGDVTMESVKRNLVIGKTLLVVITDGADIVAVNTLQIQTLESGVRVLIALVIGGHEVDSWTEQFLEVMKLIAKEHGCTELRGGAVRKGWLKKLEQFGWENAYMTIRYPLEDK